MNETFVNKTLWVLECGELIDPDAVEEVVYQTTEQWVTILIPSLLSVFGSLSYCVSYLVFYKEMSKKESFNLLFFIFISNMCTALGSCPGWPADQTFACWFEGIMTNIFTLAAVMWTVVLTWKLFCIVSSIRSDKIRWYHHLVSWSIPIFATCIPFVNSTYGAPLGLGWCWVVDIPGYTPEGAGAIWFWVSYYMWLWASFVIIIILGILMVLKFKDAHELTRKNFYLSIKNLAGYPFVILLTWLPSTFNDFIQYNYECIEVDEGLTLFCTIMGTLMGFLSAVVFWATNPKIQEYWVLLARKGFDLREFESELKAIASGTSSTGETASRGSKKGSGGDDIYELSNNSGRGLTKSPSQSSRSATPITAGRDVFQASNVVPTSPDSIRPEMIEKKIENVF
jgi:hypothetical protein